MRNSKGILLLIIGLTLFAFLGTASAGQFGAPEPASTPGYFSLGGGYFYNSDKWKLNSNSTDYKLTQNQIYLQFGAASKNIEFYIRGGAADLKFDNAFPNNDFSDDYKLFGTMGVKGFIDFNRYVGMGLFVQGSLFSPYKNKITGLVGGVSTTQEMEIKDLNELAFGLMVQGKINKICVYGGPFLYWTHAQLETTITGPGLNSSSSNDLEQSNNFGGVVGVRIPIYAGINFEVEGQFRQEFSAGGAITYSF